MLLYNQIIALERRNSYKERDVEKKHQRWDFAEDSLQISRKSVLQKHSLNATPSLNSKLWASDSGRVFLIFFFFLQLYFTVHLESSLKKHEVQKMT